eukprot:Clim_evm36s215 gene=Clim_evmTU36s215
MYGLRASLRAPSRLVANGLRTPYLAAVQSRHYSSPVEESMRQKLEAEFKPSKLDIQDTSGGCGAAFEVYIESEAFKGMRALQRERKVTAAIKEEMQDIHALRVFPSVPDA